MLKTPLEQLAYIVEKARQFDAETAPVDSDSGSNPSEDNVSRSSKILATTRPGRSSSVHSTRSTKIRGSRSSHSCGSAAAISIETGGGTH